MSSSCSTPACGSHACDCRQVATAPPADGVLLISERGHVRTKVGIMLEQMDGLRLEGSGWEDELEGLLEKLSFSERAALLAAPLTDGSPALALPAEEVLARARTPWLPDLLNGPDIFPHLQPIVSLLDGSTYGFESLLRGRIGERILSAGEIVAAARAHGAIFTLDLAGRRAALEQGMPQLIDEEVLFVNFTPTAIYDPEVCLRTTWAIARRHGLPLERVCFEVVETEQFPDLDFLRRILDEYRSRGAKVALDDLGSGNSSLVYLETLRPDIVKLDRALISGIDGDHARQRLVRAVIDYAHELDIQVVAEGIETEPELAVVVDLGADFGQGFHLGRPAPEPRRVERRVVTDLKPAHSQGTMLELRDRALASATSGVVVADALVADMPIMYVNPAFERLTGYSAAEILGRDCKFLQGPETDPAAVAEMGAAMRAGRECRVTLLNYRQDGSTYWCEVHLAPVFDRRGRLLQYVAVQNDVSDRVEAEHQLRRERDRARHLASHDPLTGLLNRRAFRTRADAALKRMRGDEAAGLLFLDLNSFKRVNDLNGHDTGDVVLCGVAYKLSRVLGDDALLARQSGDEFLAFFTAPTWAAARDRVESALAQLRSPIIEHESVGAIGASVGWALTHAEGRSLADLITEADGSMYVQKRARRHPDPRPIYESAGLERRRLPHTDNAEIASASSEPTSVSA